LRQPLTGCGRQHDWGTCSRPRRAACFVEAAAGELLEELGYERAAASVPRSELARAARARETFMSEVRARGRPLPRAWSPETVAAFP